MSLGEELLSELCFAQCELPISTGTMERAKSSLTRTLSVNGSGRELQISLPYFVRRLAPSVLGSLWIPFCGLLRQHGIPIFSSVNGLKEVPAANVPARLAMRYIDEPIDALELTTADAFELACRDRLGRTWGWSSELRTEQLGALVCAVREAAGGDTPIGIGLPLGGPIEDMRRVLAADVDFISLIGRSPRLEATDIASIVQCRTTAGELDKSNLTILVSAPISDQEQAHKLLALGASAVCIDGLLRPLFSEVSKVRTSSDSAAGMLSGMMPAVSHKQPQLTAISTALAEYRQQLADRLQSVGASDLRNFTSHVLRCCSQRGEQITGVAPLIIA